MKAKKVFETLKHDDNLIDPRFGINISKEKLEAFWDDPTEEAITVGDESKVREQYSKVGYKDKNGIYIFLDRDEVIQYKLQKQVRVVSGEASKEFRFYIYKPAKMHAMVENLKFSDGMEFDTSGELHKEERSDGWYVVGKGMLIPVADEIEADQFIDSH
jgi:hypothetical protein